MYRKTKKLLAFLLTAVMVLSLFAGFAFAGSSSTTPVRYPLFASQNIEVGYIEVSHSGGNLTVKYVVTGNWYLTETHLHIGRTLAEFPRAGRQNNPVPGLFAHSGDHDFLKEVTYTIPWTGTGNVMIAAHAEVKEVTVVTGVLTPVLTWKRSSEENVLRFPGRGAQWTIDQGFAIPLTDEVVWDGGTAYQNDLRAGTGAGPGFSFATWTYSRGADAHFGGDADLRRFQATFEIPAGYTITGGKLGSVNAGYEDMVPINDNIYIFVNESLLFWGGTIRNVGDAADQTHFLGMPGAMAIGHSPRTGPPETDGWFIPGTIPDISAANFVAGSNVLDVFAEEFAMWGAMHELKLTLEYSERITQRSESAWAATAVGVTRFSTQGNWGTFVWFTIPNNNNGT